MALAGHPYFDAAIFLLALGRVIRSNRIFGTKSSYLTWNNTTSFQRFSHRLSSLLRQSYI